MIGAALCLCAALLCCLAGCGLAEALTLPEERTVADTALEVTVGEEGMFSTLNDALTYCSGFYPAHPQGGRIVIRILEGTVIREQILCSAIDLSYITITADKTKAYPNVPVEHDASWTGVRDESCYNRPFIEGNNGARLPLIDCVFRLISENNDDNGYVCGMLCEKGASGIILDGAGFIGFFDGIIANNNSEIICRNGVLTQCGRYAAHARHISRISVRGCDLSGAYRCAVYANRVSSVDARTAHADDAHNLLLAVNDSTINANDMRVGKVWGDYVAAADALSTINCGNMTVRRYEGDGACFRVSNGSTLALHGVNKPRLKSKKASMTSQEVNVLTGEGVIYVGSGESYSDL
ncbi:MAG: hypothetical protein ACI4PG_02975 [Candidatus Ventricola sp.]